MHAEVMLPESTVLAVVKGKPFTENPKDLFIPPDALRVLLDSFTGPLDLLLYLIRQQDIDILDIPIAKITRQYMQYIELLEAERMELAADYLVMAAILAEIKSKLLLPVVVVAGEESEEDPRMELVRRLQAYERLKQSALELDALPRYERDVFHVSVKTECLSMVKAFPDVELSSVVSAMFSLLTRQQQERPHQITREPLSVRERMTFILQRIQQEKKLTFSQCFLVEEGRMGLVVSLLAILELTRQTLIVLIQTAAFAPIYLQIK